MSKQQPFLPVTVVNQTILEEPFSVSIQDILLKLPRGVYSVARSVTTNSILLFESHIDRLRKSDKNIFKTLSELTQDRNNLKELVLKNLQIALRKLIEINEEDQIQEKSVLIFISDRDTFSQQEKGTLNKTFLSKRLLILIHVYPIMKVPNSIKVQICGQARKQPNTKDTKWVSERKKFIEKRSIGVGEILLANKNKELTEGATSNFFIIMNSKIYTSPDNTVLCGITRKLTIKVCKKMGMKIIYKNPKIDKIDQWEEAFITSSSRLVLPIDSVLYEKEEGQLIEKTLDSPKITRNIRRNLIKQMEIESYVIDL
ncbi:d-aminoacid aminotransferase-like plp-dependent enzymes superfamily protein [Anaeramoeba flamelloides]|uniref:D-aminoacid aminotransferase-like plp-dependent enzymes superfamily protein n=1 Tax=Anaeramoeba flamelloides TaxID=1746091 RepID=A0ABQ8YQ41_9EUKA|nr:d-aminoacid aminotransferase-like plp-dependent enzymes superfamily protein [Anaeramoeba flamelloides]